MKITMLGSGSSASSLSKRLVAFGRHLGAQGHSITVILPAADKYNNFTPDQTIQIPNVRLIQPWQPATKSIVRTLIPYLVTSFVALTRSWPDVVYIYKPTPITIAGLLFRLIPGKRVILDLDDLGSEVMRLEGRSRVEIELVATCEWLAIHTCSAIVVSSTYLKRQVRKSISKKPVIVLSNGVEPDEYNDVLQHKLRPVVYYYGAINRLSIIEPLLRAWPAVVTVVPKARLHILGSGDALQDAEQLCTELRVTKSIDFLGWINDTRLQSYTEFADIGVCYQPDIPTVRAASNLKVFQYMALSSAVVVSDVGDLKRYVHDGVAGLAVPPGNVEQLAETLVDLLGNDSKRVRLALAARQRVEKNYSWEHLSSLLAAFLSEPGSAQERTI